MPKVKCKLCKIPIDRDEAYRTNLQSFCGVDHYKDYMSAADKKRNRGSKPVVDPEWEATRQFVMSIDGGRCRVCGTKYNLHVHHIVYRSERKDDSPDNLITLCSVHHNLVHSDKQYYQPECQRLIAIRNTGNIFSRIKIKG